MQRKHLTIGLFGFGCVGYGLYQVLQKTPGLRSTIKTICIKDPNKPRPIPAERFTTNADTILTDPEINVVVELIDDSEAAFALVSAALRNGKAVVTANKKMIAEHFSELLHLQQCYQVPLLYEAACCASIPIIRNLEEYYDTDLLTSIEGVVNGSCNYILTKLLEEELPFAAALAQAQNLGYAESNPSLDIDGHDSKYKLQILLAHAFGVVVNPSEIFTVGITAIGELERQYAKEKGYKIKLVAQAVKGTDGNLSFFVLPKFVPANHKLHTVNGVYNGVIAHTCFAETQFFVGKGAGAYPTASAVLSDLAALTHGYKYEYKKMHTSSRQQVSNNLHLKVYVSAAAETLPLVKTYFSGIQETFSTSEKGFVIGSLPQKKLAALNAAFASSISVVLFNLTDAPANELTPATADAATAQAAYAGYTC